MAWETELGEAIYTSPSGKKYEFAYNSQLSSETDLKTAIFTFPSKDGALAVALGVGQRKFSLTCVFFGLACLKEAEEFEKALKEKGVGTLQHPLYGTFKVVPTGTIKRDDDTVAGVGTSQLSVTFIETITDSSIISKTESIDELEKKVEDLKEKSKMEMVKDFFTKTANAIVKARNAYKKALKTISDGLSKIAEMERKISSSFNTVYNEIFTPLDDLVGNLDLVASQTVNLIHLPSKIACNSLKKIESYSECITGIIEQFKNLDPNMDNVKNQWAITKIALANLVTACAIGSAEDNEDEEETKKTSSKVESNATFNKTETNSKSKSIFATREEAVTTAESLIGIYDQVTENFEKFVEKDVTVETGETYDAMRDCVSLATQIIINQSFDLPTKRIFTLKEDRQVIDLVYELYGNLEKLDEFILDNNLTYDEIEIIPAGREVGYYV